MNSSEVTSDAFNEPAASSPQSQACLRCGGGRLEPGSLTERGRVSFYPRNASFWTFVPYLEVQAFMCLECGHIELFGDFEKVKKIVKNKQ